MVFKSAKDFVLEMMDNEGKVFSDNYGRKWKYSKYAFWFMDIGGNLWIKSFECIHLFNTDITMSS